MSNKETKSTWVDALLAGYVKTTPADEEMAMGNEALAKTAALAFGSPKMKDDSRSQVVASASKALADQRSAEGASSAILTIRTKLADGGIDPVALGVASKDEWEGCSDPAKAERIAKAAALESKEQAKRSWEHSEVQPARTLSSRFDPMTSKGSIVMSCFAPSDDSVGRPSRVPQNANSIFEPDRIDKFANEKNEHDESVAASRQRKADGEAKRKEALLKDVKDAPEQMSGSRIVPSGGMDRDVFAHRLGPTQISIMDTLGSGTLSREDMKGWFQENFFSKVEDKKSETKQANEDRRKAIQGERTKDREWEQVGKQTTARSGIIESLLGK